MILELKSLYLNRFKVSVYNVGFHSKQHKLKRTYVVDMKRVDLRHLQCFSSFLLLIFYCCQVRFLLNANFAEDINISVILPLLLSLFVADCNLEVNASDIIMLSDFLINSQFKMTAQPETDPAMHRVETKNKTSNAKTNLCLSLTL